MHANIYYKGIYVYLIWYVRVYLHAYILESRVDVLFIHTLVNKINDILKHISLY